MKKQVQRNKSVSKTAAQTPFFTQRSNAFFNSVQPKLKVSKADDPQEKQADRVADSVMRMSEDTDVQRQPMEEEEEMMQPKIQREEEEEAAQPKLQTKGEEEEAQTKLMRKEEEEEAQPKLMRKGEEDEESVQMKPNGKSPMVTQSLHQSLQSSKSGGEPLQKSTARFMGNAIGADFSNVRVHTDAKAVQMNQQLNAKAFAYGHNLYFNKGQYNPNTSQGKWLLAHELTHTVQQKAVRKKSIQRNGPTTRPATTAERREIVQEAIRFLNQGASFYALMQIDAAGLTRTLTGIQSTLTHNLAIINNDLNADATLTRNLKQSYTAALRALMTRAASQLQRPAVELYLQNMHLIPRWAMPGVSDFNLANDAQKRAFLQATNAAFNATNTFAGYTTLNDSTVRDLLGKLQDLVYEQMELIVSDFNNDATLKSNLKTAYQAALNRVLTTAATQMNQSVTQLSVTYMDLIPDGMENTLAGTSTPIPQGATANASGNVVFTVNGIEITIKPDRTRSKAGAETKYTPHIGRISARLNRDRTIRSFTGPANPPKIDIQTFYGPNLSATSTSAYGRGTTQNDRDRGNTSLGFHEGRHGLDFIRYIRDTTAPAAFDGVVGEPASDFRTKMQAWDTAWTTFLNGLEPASLSSTDCVGTTIDQHHGNTGSNRLCTP